MTILHWDSGTAYDFFTSLHVLHHPVRFGVRPAWAAGVRSRLPAGQREYMEKVQTILPVPLVWLGNLDLSPKDAAPVLNLLEAMPPEKRTNVLFNHYANQPAGLEDFVHRLNQQGQYDPNDKAELARIFSATPGKNFSDEQIELICTFTADPAEFGIRYFEALQSYYHVFFAEEELRIREALQISLEQAQEKSHQYSLPILLEDLTHGVRFDAILETPEILLVPSYWANPLVFHTPINSKTTLFQFGSRPETQPIVPGEQVPASLVNSLKAIADPTRLKILRYLAGEPQTPSELARRLRLRPPTVIHHLNALRLAGLVQIILQPDDSRRYALRSEAVQNVSQTLLDFLLGG